MTPDRGPDPVDVTLVPTVSPRVACGSTSAPAGEGSGEGPPAVTVAARSAVIPPDPGLVTCRLDEGVATGPVVFGYAIERELGRGGMGVVYKARQLSLNRPVALKMILAGYQASARDRARFRAEAEAVARLTHPNIVQIHEVGDQAGRPYLAFELVDGTTLQHKLGGSPQPTRPAARLVEQLARAMHHAHQCGVVHRDLKPGNVLLAPPDGGSGHAADPVDAQATALYGTPKVTDFGLAKRLEDDVGQTRSGDLLGTPSYMAPEQAAGRSAVAGPKADVYALGAVLYEMLTGRPPFRGATPLETLHQVLHDEPVPPGRLRSKLPKDLERICLKCLEKDPGRRYATAEGLADDLRRHLSGESVQARPAPIWERTWRWCRKNPVPAGLLVVATLGSTFGLWYLSWLTQSVVESTAIQGAEQQSETFDELNKYYGNVALHVGNRRGRGWEHAPGAAPFPATLTIELGERITARGGENGTKVRLYSDAPFKNRPRGTLDDFEQEALRQLRQTPDRPFYRFEEMDGRRVLRYTTARRMTAESCVKCHNDDPDSPRHDWKLGDVRGVLEVIRPLSRDQERVSQGLRGTAQLITGVGAGVLTLSALMAVFGRRPRRALLPPPDGGPAEGQPSPPAPPPMTGGAGKPTPPPAPEQTSVEPTSAPPRATDTLSRPARRGLPMSDPHNPDAVDQTLVPPAHGSRPDSAPTPDLEATQIPGATGVGTPEGVTLLRPAPGATPSEPPEATLFRPHSQPVSPTVVSRLSESPTPVDRTLPSSLPADRDCPRAANPEATSVSGGTGAPSADVDVTQTFASSPARPGSFAPNPAQSGNVVGRFALRGLHARGGLGEVYTARDVELNREVALKRIQSRYADEPSSRRRFLTEAEITARLDHPGVVPVFGLVADAFGRPCYAMRFIRGESLKDEIDRYHRQGGAAGSTAPASDRSDKTEPTSGGAGDAAPLEAGTAAEETDARRIAFRQLLQRFIAVCQAIAYAHTRNVIHRDIKPANVMVGTFGETLVVDWGLAKALDDAPNAEEMLKRAAEVGYRRDPDATEPPDDVTAVGTAVGTPAYMSPEQAAGRVDLVGPASDIYSLGATLYCLLTGRAPFSGNNPTETIHRVQKGEFPSPRGISPAVPKPLEAVCLKAMAVRPGDRYPTAQALANDVERWLSDEPVSCYRDHLPARLARWARRHPARVAGTVSLLLTGFIATGIVLGVVNQARKRTKESLELVSEARARTETALKAVTAAQAETKLALDQVTAQKKQTEEERQRAIDAGNLARRRFALARGAFETAVISIQSRLDDRAGTYRLRQELLQEAQKGLENLLETAANIPGSDRQDTNRLLFWAKLQLGDVQKGLGKTLGAARDYETAVAAANELLTADPTSVEIRKELATGYDRLAEVYTHMGRISAAFDSARKALDLRVRLLESSPTDRATRRELAAAQDRLASIDLERGDTLSARAACTESLNARKALYEAAPKDTRAAHELAQSHERDCEILLRMGNTAAAEKAVRAALALQTGLANALPDRIEAQRGLAAAHARLGEVSFDRADMGGALKAYRDGLAVLDAVLAKDPLSAGIKADAAMARGRIGFVLLRTGDTTGALKEAQQCNALCRDLAQADPGSAKVHRMLALSHEYLGDALLANGRVEEALREYDEANRVLKGLATDDPENVGALTDRAQNLERVGNARLASGRLLAAIEAFTDSANVRDRVAESDPASARARRQLAASYERLCDAHLEADNRLQARVAAYKAYALFRALADKDPGSGQAKRDLATAYGKWGQVAFEQGDLTATMILWHKSLAGFDALLGIDASNTQALEDKATALERLGKVNGAVGYLDTQLGDVTAALAIREKLAAANPTNPLVSRDLMATKRQAGDALIARRQFDEARKSYQQARAIAAKFGDAPVFAKEIEKVTEKLALLDAVRVGEKNPATLALQFPPDVRARALEVLIYEHLRRHEPVNASRDAEQLVSNARGPNDLYAAARAFAVCASRVDNPQGKASYTAAALSALTRAAKAGLRNADDLRKPWWDAVRDREEFKAAEALVRAQLPLAPLPREK